MAGIDISACATSKTQSDAVNWANAQVGKSLDQDGVYGAQCVDLIRYYYQFLGVSPVSGNGCDYATNSLPSGWQRIRTYNGFVPQPGDVAVWTYASSSYGHVAIITSADSSKMNVVEQNGSTHITRSHSYSYSYGTFYGVIRPNFTSGSGGSSGNINAPEKPSIPKITILSNSQRKIKFEWTPSANTTCYNLFIFSVNDMSNPIQSHWAIRNNELITTLPNGKYVVKLCSENETPNQNYYTDGDLSSVFEISSLIPDKPYLSTINITNSSRKVDFKWDNICNATCYNLFIYSVNNTNTPIQSHWAIRKNEISTTLPNGKYVARLCSENETSNQNYYTDGDLSSVFEVNSLIPDKPKNPIIIVDNNDGKVTFRWDKVTNASCYNLFIYSANNTNSPVQSHWAIRNNELITTLSNGTYVAKLCSENETSAQNYYTDGNITKSFIVNKSIHTHNYDDGKITKSATCSSTGTKTYICTICGATKTETIAKTSHSYSWKNSDGYIVSSCNNCKNEKVRLPFEDLCGYEYYGDYVAYTSVYNKFITGTNPPERTLFSPTASINRAMFVTILYRMAGEPYKNANPYKTSPFTDITDTSVYYYDAACWALKNGITTETSFKPFNNVNREQTASFLFRYAQKNGKLGNSVYKNTDLSKYSDYRTVSGWAFEAMQWANYNGMITGTQQNTLNPQGATQRIHATKILNGFGKKCNIGYFA